MSEVGATLRDIADVADAIESLRDLSDKATQGPWIRKWASLDVHHMGGDDALRSQEDVDFAVAAVNLIRDMLGWR